VNSVTYDVQHRSWGADAGSYGRLMLRFSTDVLFSIEVGYLAQIVKPHWVILGDRGSFIKYGVDPQEAALLRGNIDAAAEDPAERALIKTEINGLTADLVVDSIRGDWTAYYRNIADVLAERAELAVTADQVRRAIRVFDAAAQAARNGETVRVRL
jgi:scyllo-inositol 2-dehydrogenase (NADP+)